MCLDRRKARHRVQHNEAVCPADFDLKIPHKAGHPQLFNIGALETLRNFLTNVSVSSNPKDYSKAKQNPWPLRRRVSGGRMQCSLSYSLVPPRLPLCHPVQGLLAPS